LNQIADEKAKLGIKDLTHIRVFNDKFSIIEDHLVKVNVEENKFILVLDAQLNFIRV